MRNTKLRLVVLISASLLVTVAAYRAWLDYQESTVPVVYWFEIPEKFNTLNDLNSNLASELKHAQLDDTIQIHNKYTQLVQQVINPSTSDDDLVMLAIAAETQDPWLSYSEKIYQTVFYECVFSLGKRKTKSAVRGLNKIKNYLIRHSHFDGHLAETIEEVEENQRTKFPTD